MSAETATSPWDEPPLPRPERAPGFLPQRRHRPPITGPIPPVGNGEEPAEGGLALRLKVATSDNHRAAESRPFVQSLLGGQLGAAAHVDLTDQYLTIYEALEEVGHEMSHTAIAPLLKLRLDRVQSLRLDLARLGGPVFGPTMAARSYAAHLRSAVAGSPAAWLGHAYARYLGDLSGGQAIAAMLRRHYGLSDDVVTFYRFPGSAPVLRDTFRATLNAIELTEHDEAKVEAEARRSFHYAEALFTELAQRH